MKDDGCVQTTQEKFFLLDNLESDVNNYHEYQGRINSPRIITPMNVIIS